MVAGKELLMWSVPALGRSPVAPSSRARAFAAFAALAALAACGGKDGSGLNQSDGTNLPDLDTQSTSDTLAPPDGGAGDTTVTDSTALDAEPGDSGPTDATAPGDTATAGDASDTEDADATAGDTAASDTTADDTGGPSDAAASDTATGDAGTTCPLYHQLCDGVCVNTNSDPLHCGSCDVTCDQGLGQVCSAGGCATTCLGELVPCDGTCVDLLSDADHCGSCPPACSDGQGCSDGTCVPTVTLGDPPPGCADFGPLVVAVGGTETCLDAAAETNFTWALCSCSDVDLSNEVATDAYDSRLGPYVPGGVGGGVGTGGYFDASNKLSIGGTFWSADQMWLSNDVAVAGELHVGGDLSTALMSVALDAWVAGDVVSSGLTISGTLHRPATSSVSGVVNAGATVTEPVAVGQPCRCASDQLVPVQDLVDHFAATNDNAYVGLDAGVLDNPVGAVHLTLPCGVYYLDAIASNHAVTIVASGRAALFIGGSITGSGNIQIVPDPGAELDVFVAGTLNTSSKLRLGSPNYPALLRMYFGTSGEIRVSNEIDVGGFIWAGYGSLRASNKIEIFGGLFTGAFHASNKVDIHYDRAILGVGAECEAPPGTTCGSCEDCANQACVAGQCGACATSDDCCAPLVCIEGQCLSLGIGTE